MKKLMSEIGFNTEEQEFISSLYQSLDKSILDEFEELKKLYFMLDTDMSQAECYNCVKNALTALSEKASCHEYSICLIFLLFCCDELKKNYEKANLDISLYYSLICDITYKMRVCRKLHGVIGVFTFDWFHSHFLMKLFCLGRFQYIEWKFTSDKPYHTGDITVNPGDTVYNIHIPESGSMTEEKRYNSYKKAFEFFGKKKGEYIVFACETWILYEPNKNIFPENSNLMGFYNDFDVIRSYEHQQIFKDAWRIFDRNFDGDTSVLPRNTTLQKNFAKWLDKGNSVGEGYGVIIFDGENIINKK